MKILIAPIVPTAIGITCLICVSLTEVPEKIKTDKDFAYIPAGTCQTGELVSSFQPFLMLNHEVTNGEYREFLHYLKIENRLEDLVVATPDTNAWNFSEGVYLEPMAEYYFSHPAYGDYPVVNITAKGAALYCAWQTEQLRKIHGDKITVKLPTSPQWIYAASGGLERNQYSWSGMGLRDEKGNFRANYYTVGEESITRAEDGKFTVSPETSHSLIIDGNFYMAQAISYKPNGYELYNMCGNVAELVGDGSTAKGGDWYSPGYDIRIHSSKKVDKAVPFVGFRPVIVFE